MQSISTSLVPSFICNPLPTSQPIRTPTRLSKVKCSASVSRRHFLSASVAATAALLMPSKSEAISGLHIFPLKDSLTNAYFLMRACETNSDASKIVNSNPAYKLSLEQHSLTRKGVDQAIRVSEALQKEGLSSDAWLWPSVTISSFQTAEILASKLRIRREQIVPEYSFLDARGVGALNGGTTSEVRRIVIDNDRTDSDWRPRSGEDGTPNDSTNDVFVRVTQLLNKLETQYYGENIVIISPDSDPLSILQATLTGQDLRSHHQLEYFPGEVRRVKELVTDDYGKTVVQPEALIICRPDTGLLA
ncbi:hypothetical protein BWQ96_02046 [Gracilariopsis chorda]|uniref:2,3-bisphosphoglycerate-dependent phosphoglycerate mutase n=1 Tax=Gracilariopsis chorda TaxID=448386 RepID=A0A2V3J156_9FLOR|nr:hypothetical protein BWQ96_02046 [Gracilariopsis chorda]|eukprot:PXF48094.1 hypothetical protein BWQ96_02046 [Gracilariopsis chorda]